MKNLLNRIHNECADLDGQTFRPFAQQVQEAQACRVQDFCQNIARNLVYRGPVCLLPPELNTLAEH